MIDFNLGKIYKIISDETDKIYIGSTCATLKRRFSVHRSQAKSDSDTKSSSHLICDFDDAKIELIEDFPCKSKKELQDREAYYYDLFEDIRVNKYKPNRTEKERYHENFNGRKDKQIANVIKYRSEHPDCRKVKITCECGSTYVRESKARHQRTRKHSRAGF